MADRSLVVSAPGKVLFSGGFLVLDRHYTGLVFGLNARIHVHIKSWQPDPRLIENNSSVQLVLVVSPQFRDSKWLYRLSFPAEAHEADPSVNVEQIRSEDEYTRSPNKFVETALRYTLTYLHYHLKKTDVIRRTSTKITILADDDYYSQSQTPLEKPSAQKHKPSNGTALHFTNFGCKLSEAHKTGLGSSAALTTAFVGAIMVFYSSLDPSVQALSSTPALNQKQIHNLAQAAHCAAQGKVGSGFDVAAAVFGSCLYRRFSPTILENVGDPTSSGFGRRLLDCIDDRSDAKQKWDTEVLTQNTVQIPSSLLLVMCDVDCGSETPGMVRNVLQWRKDKPEEADLLWSALQQGTEDLCRELRQLSMEEKVTWDGLKNLGDIILANRSLVREMSMKSNVPIEPPVITELLDYCTALPGVVGGVAPGAGGYDAIALLIRNEVDILRDLENHLEGWKSDEQTSSASIGHVRLLKVKQEKEGVRFEDRERYGDWI